MIKHRNLLITLFIFIAFCISVCFIPINASKLIPIIEKQVANEYGIDVHIEKLILRLGPSLKLKAPTMHLMYKDGEKFGQFNTVKFFIPWSSVFNVKKVLVKRVIANKIILRFDSNNSNTLKLKEGISAKKFDELPNIKLKSYSVSYIDKTKNKNYKLIGNNFELSKVNNYDNLQIKTIGDFFINGKSHLSYDLSLLPNYNLSHSKYDININQFLEQIEDLGFYSDIIVNLRLYNDVSNNLLASGTVNLDNISVLDPENKTPKSFIYLTFWGDRIGILSNIYASTDKKVYIDGVLNNSKKKSVDLKVKTDDIDLNVLFKKMRLLSDFSKFKNIEALDGVLKADFNIKGDINKIKSFGYLNISKGFLRSNGVDINNINANIDFSNNVINLTEVVGYVNKAPILLKGKIDKFIDIELLMSKVDLKHLVPSKYGIRNGVLSLSANITGNIDNIIHQENVQLENFSADYQGNIINFDSLRFDNTKDSSAYVSNVSYKNRYTELIKIPTLKLNFDKEMLVTPVTNIFMPNSKIKAKLEISNFNNKNYSFNLSSSGFINSRDIKNVKSNYASYPINLSISGNNAAKNIDAQILVEQAFILDEPSLINFEAKLENQDLKIEDLCISSYMGSFLENEKLNIKGDKKIIITGNIVDIFKPVFKNVRVFIPKQFNINYHDTIAQIKGDVFLNGAIKQPNIVGEISAQNIINQYLQLSISNLLIDFNKNNAVLNAPQIKIGDTVMGMNATLSTDFSDKVFVKSLNLKSKYINTDTFLMYKDTPAFNFGNVIIADGKLYSEKIQANIYNSPICFTAFLSDFSLKDNILSLKNINSELINGKLAGKLDFNLKDEHFDSNISARGVSAAPIFDIISTRKDSISGVMDFDAKIQGNISTKSSLFGNIKFIVHNGRMGSLGKLEHLLYAQNVIADNMLRTSLSVVTKAITLKDTGLFKYLRGDIDLSDGMANVKFLQTQGPLMSLFIKGRYNPENDYGQLVILGRLSDEVVSGLGAFGDFSFKKLLVMLTGEDRNFNILPEDFEKLPPLPMKNTKEFRSTINGIIDRASSVITFNWISYTQKSYKQKDVPNSNVKIPEFVDSLPY